MKLENILFIIGCAGSTLALTSSQIIKDMGIGWNLGNTLEACGDWINGKTVKDYETAWGNPETTEEIIKGVKSYGFSSVRIPVAWSNLMTNDYTINPLLLERAKEVVNYVVGNDMYAILNIHWDNGWFEKFATEEKSSFEKFHRIWEQVSDYFKDFDEKLIFESLNEEGCWNDLWNRWSNAGDKSKAYGLLNTMNKDFVEIVRSSGGNNGDRHLLLAGYCTDIDLTVDEAFVTPKDNKIMVSVHYYTPSTFTIISEDADWGKASRTWGTDSEVQFLLNDFKKIKTRFVDKGIPIIIGEYGTTITNKDMDSVYKYLRTVAETSLANDMLPVLWDNGEHFDRKKLVFKDPKIGEIYKDIASKLGKSVGDNTSDNTTDNTSGDDNNTQQEECWSEPDYPCCKNTCEVFMTDDFEWGIENNGWCGIPSSCTESRKAEDSCPGYPDYPCCEDCKAILTEEDGRRWGVLNNDWCSIKNSC